MALKGFRAVYFILFFELMRYSSVEAASIPLARWLSQKSDYSLWRDLEAETKTIGPSVSLMDSWVRDLDEPFLPGTVRVRLLDGKGRLLLQADWIHTEGLSLYNLRSTQPEAAIDLLFRLSSYQLTEASMPPANIVELRKRQRATLISVLNRGVLQQIEIHKNNLGIISGKNQARSRVELKNKRIKECLRHSRTSTNIRHG